MRTPPRLRGFTLIELMIALATSMAVVLLAVGAATAQQQAYFKGQRLRQAQVASRDVLLYLERKVPLAGYGMDASLGLDFKWYTPAAARCPSAVGTCSRDRTNDVDELVFYARNPSFWVPSTDVSSPPPPKGKAWQLVSMSASAVHLAAHAGDRFLPGQILQVVCPGTRSYAYFTVGTDTGAIAAETADQTIVPTAVVSTDPFQRQDLGAGFATTCRVFQIDRYRLHVQPVALGGGQYTTFLMLDDGVNPEVMLAEGVEAFQVAYVLGNGTTVGTTAGTAISFPAANDDQTVSGTATERIALTAFPGNAAATGKSPYAVSSFYDYIYSSPMRQTVHQANIRAVRISMVLRSSEPDTGSKPNLVVNSGFTLLNQQGIPSWISGEPVRAFGTDGYQRVRVETTINLPNMLVRSIPAF